jgi:hypothetical protein
MFKAILCSLAILAMFQLHVDNAQAAGRRIKATGGCKIIVPLGPLIWKGCSGSGHLSGDPRGNGAALIKKQGSGLNPSTSCIPILNNEGKRISGLQLYPGNNPRGPYAWRGYTNFGCGAGMTMLRLAAASRGLPIYLQMNSRQCIKLPKSRANYNSSQRC